MPADQALPFLQYGALGVVTIMILVGSAFGFRLVGSFERSVERLSDSITKFQDTVAEGFKSTSSSISQSRRAVIDELIGVESRLSDQIEDPDNLRTTRPDNMYPPPGPVVPKREPTTYSMTVPRERVKR